MDAMCGGLRAYLRLCGHDAAYALDRGAEADDAIAALARDEDRVVVTRDRDLAAATDGVLLRERDSLDQLRELAAAGISLEPTDDPERCGRCNGQLDRVPADDATPDYAPDPADEDVWRCRDCEQCFWKGSHHERMVQTLSVVRRNENAAGS
nr:Mut7-C RNAse domain-containing protein [Halorubellus salinus]